jgi:hypothetical protein
MKSDTVRLCGHHLLCILTYIGRGYTSEFTENMTAVISRINQGAEIQIVSGPDDICTPMLNDVSHHCSSNDVAERDAVALITVSIALSRHVRVGMHCIYLGTIYKYCTGHLCKTHPSITGITVIYAFPFVRHAMNALGKRHAQKLRMRGLTERYYRSLLYPSEK